GRARTERIAALQLDVGAEHRARLRAHLPLHRRREALHRDERGDAERDRREEQEQPPSREAALAEREREELACGHAAALSATILPSARRIVRRARPARRGSWVTSTSVVPRSRFSSSIRAMMPSPVAASRLPVGSSANRILGSWTNARASATRCCSPPESCVG